MIVLREKVVNKLMINWAASFLSVVILLSMVALPALAAVAANTVNSSSIVDGSIKTRDIKRNAINSSRIRDYSIRKEDIHSGSINKYKLTSNAVNTYKIQDGQVKSDDIADRAVNSAKIADNSVTNADISPGAAISDSKISYSTKTGYLSIPAAAFNPRRETYDYYQANFISMDSGSGYFYAPVQLPQGAVITKLRYNALDNDGVDYTSARIYRFDNFDAGTMHVMAFLTTGVTADSISWQSLSTTAISNATVDNDSYAYVVEVFLDGSGVYAGNTVIEYTYTSPGS